MAINQVVNSPVSNNAKRALPLALPRPDLFLEILTTPSLLTNLSPDQWSWVLRVAHNEGLLPRISSLALADASAVTAFPAKALEQMRAAAMVGSKHEQVIRWEADRIEHALRHVEAPVVLLKGAAYAVSGLPPARGRLVSDVDILVPESALPVVEASLLAAGWEPTHYNPYDQFYYRQWMHELPPLQHTLRQTLIDVHHTILPRTSRLKPDPEKLIRSAVRVDNTGVFVLAPGDMVLHSAAHLFCDGEFEHGLRDLVDLHELLTHFGGNETFWETLVPRARDLDLERPLYYALRFTRDILGTDIPDWVLSASRIGAPSNIVGKLMDILIARVLRPKHPDRREIADWLAYWILYVRSHYLRMPLHLLIPHLIRKAFAKREDVVVEV